MGTMRKEDLRKVLAKPSVFRTRFCVENMFVFVEGDREGGKGVVNQVRESSIRPAKAG
jgi:hypothetical protein